MLYWDLNPDKEFNPELVEKKLKLKYSEVNFSIITREQIRDKAICASTLDFFFSTQNISELRILDKNESDHYQLLAKVQIVGKMIKKQIKFHIQKSRYKQRVSKNDTKQWAVAIYIMTQD